MVLDKVFLQVQEVFKAQVVHMVLVVLQVQEVFKAPDKVVFTAQGKVVLTVQVKEVV